MTLFQQIVAWLRRSGRTVALEGVINFALPYIIFVMAKPHWGEVQALIASSAPPMLWTVIGLIRNRRIDAVAMLALLGIALSLIAVLGGGSARFLLLRERMVTIIIGLVFLGSAAIGRPIIYFLAQASMRKSNPSEAERLESLRHDATVKRSMTVLTLVWGFGLVIEAAISASLVFTLPTQQFLLVSPILGYSTTGALALWTVVYVRRRRRLGDARRAAEAAAAAEAANTAIDIP